ncbi:MAG TPA: amidohydrolase family protein [Gaiellaceae bacterium]|nr:amidohydrolase family protein [Gaiellaceae bacterium]
MVIDCHCHAGKGDGFTGPWDTRASLSKYLRRADTAGIERTVVFPPFHSDYRTANRELAAVVRSHRGRLIGFAFVHPARDAGRIESLVREAVLEHGFKGIKVHRHDARITREVCETARRHSLPILYDVLGETPQVELLAREFPTVAFVIPHLGSWADDWAAQKTLVDTLVRCPNVYADTSGVRRFDVLAEAARRAGPKLLFGSDGPFCHPGLELAKVRCLPLASVVRRDVEGLTLLRLIARAGRYQPPRRQARAETRRTTSSTGSSGRGEAGSHAASFPGAPRRA